MSVEGSTTAESSLDTVRPSRDLSLCQHIVVIDQVDKSLTITCQTNTPRLSVSSLHENRNRRICRRNYVVRECVTLSALFLYLSTRKRN